MAEERPSSPVDLSSPAPSTTPAPSSPPLVPKKKAIRLPFHVSYLPNDAVAKTQRLCGICRQNTSPYACPRCQIPYCSLTCYQNTSKHSQCSEPFYKAEIELDIASSQGKDGKGGGKTREEKDKMMEMLKRFEEGVGSEEPLEWDEEEGKEGEGEEQADGLDELAELLESAGLDGVPPEELLAMLPPDLRSQFLSSVANASSQPSSVLQTLLESDELREEEESPWWLTPADGVQKIEEEGIRTTKRSIPPALVEAPDVRPSSEVAKRVGYNIVAVAIAYVYTILTFRRSPLALAPSIDLKGVDLEERRAMLDYLLSLVPFVEEPKSTVLLGSFKEAKVYVDSLLDPTSILPIEIISSHLLPLLNPPPAVSLISDSPPPPNILLALSDLHLLLFQTASASTKSAHKRIAKKVEFFIGSAGAWERGDWESVQEETRRVLEKEKEERAEQGNDEEVAFKADEARGEGRGEGRKIEVLEERQEESLPVSSITEILEDEKT